MSRRLKQGEKAPHFKTTDWQGKPFELGKPDGKTTLLCFFRYASCPLCNLRIRELMQAQQKLTDANVRIVTVFQSPAERINRYVGQQKPAFPILPDPHLTH